MKTTIRLGTRGSALALKQTEQVKAMLTRKHPGLLVEICILKTAGDRNQKQPLPQLGTQGIFTKELESALLNNEIDAAVFIR